MLAISISSLIVATIAVYFSCTFKDEVFKVGTGFAGFLFVLITLVCAPWLLKVALVLFAIPFILDFIKIWSVEHYN